MWCIAQACTRHAVAPWQRGRAQTVKDGVFLRTSNAPLLVAGGCANARARASRRVLEPSDARSGTTLLCWSPAMPAPEPPSCAGAQRCPISCLELATCQWRPQGLPGNHPLGLFSQISWLLWPLYQPLWRARLNVIFGLTCQALVQHESCISFRGTSSLSSHI
jgi:hypothetical protein